MLYSEDRELSALSQLRKWIHMTNEKLGKIEANFSKKAVARKKLDRLAADQQEVISPSLVIVAEVSPQLVDVVRL
uniref:Uncharacterized protein n=1 Tax=Parascaris equorum TaxID=6256 RepID=A0A914S3Q9_PAREQ